MVGVTPSAERNRTVLRTGSPRARNPALIVNTLKNQGA
ncbi:hypothetical protein STXM2123_4768 [Streptomyces sp. F-3]|nr:hypothetical protein STXM2123_4768 [Streptomyces sp. F-3]